MENHTENLSDLFGDAGLIRLRLTGDTGIGRRASAVVHEVTLAGPQITCIIGTSTIVIADQ